MKNITSLKLTVFFEEKRVRRARQAVHEAFLNRSVFAHTVRLRNVMCTAWKARVTRILTVFTEKYCQIKAGVTVLLFSLTLASGILPEGFAEPPPPPAPPTNPFGSPDQPLPPSDISDFEEEDELGDQNFGFNPPPPTPPSPPTAEPREATPPSSPPQKVSSPPRNAVPAVPSNQAKTPPKLADYLELESSVKGLEVKNFDLPDRDIKDVVTLISKWTGKNFILDQKVRGKITIMGPSQVTLQEAYAAFLSSLEANGLTTVQSGKFIRIIESAEARRAPVKTYAGDYAPKDDQFITRIVQLKYINADEVQREFRDLTTRQGKLFAYEPTNSIIITDTGSNIQRIKELLETLDVKSFETTLHVLRIRHGAAKTIAEMLGEIYGEDKKGAGASRSFRRSALERTRGGGIISKVIPDEQTNSLIILANQAGFDQLRQIVNRLDVKVTDTGRIHVYYCEYAKAEDLASTLSALSGGGGGTSRPTRRGSSPGSTTPGASTPAPAGGGASTGSSSPVTAELEGGVKVTADAPTNSLVITANSADFQTLKRVIKKLDIPRLQVFIETAIMEVEVGDTTKFGLNYAHRGPGKVPFDATFIGDTESLTGFLSGTPGSGLTLPLLGGDSQERDLRFGATTLPGVPIPNFLAILSLLTTNTKTSILSTPQIIALDNEEAIFKVQDKIPVQTSFNPPAGSSTITAGTGNIERQEVGVSIKLTPNINAASKTIRLKIEQEVTNVKNTGLPTGLNSIQIATTSRTTNTNVVVKDRDYVMLGGLMSDKINETTQKVPLLGDIPILGWLFKTKSWKATKSNLVMLLNPKIIGTSVSSSNLIREKMGKRDKFLDQNTGGDDEHEEGVNEIKERIEEQDKRSKDESAYDYRNNFNEDDSPPSPPSEESDSPPSEKTPDTKLDLLPPAEVPSDQSLKPITPTPKPNGTKGEENQIDIPPEEVIQDSEPPPT